MFDINSFLLAISATMFPNGVGHHQSEGMEIHLDYFTRSMMGYPVEYLAYGLATTYHECAGKMQPIKEYGSNERFTRLYDINGKRKAKALELGNDQPGDGAKYCGRGCAQVTGKHNYAHHGKKHGVDLIANPDLLLHDHSLSVAVMYQGMLDGDFTGKKLDDYWTDNHAHNSGSFDAIGARRIINGRDKAKLIAGYYDKFLGALLHAKAIYESNAKPDYRRPVPSHQTANKPVPTETVYITAADEMPRETISADDFRKEAEQLRKPSFEEAKTQLEQDYDGYFDTSLKPKIGIIEPDSKPWYKSKLIGTAALIAGGGVSAVAARHGYNVPADIIVDALGGGTIAGGVLVGILRKWFTNKLLKG